MAEVATISRARSGEVRSRLVAWSIWAQSQVVAFIAAAPNWSDMAAKDPLTAFWLCDARKSPVWQRGFSAWAPSQLMSPPAARRCMPRA